ADSLWARTRMVKVRRLRANNAAVSGATTDPRLLRHPLIGVIRSEEPSTNPAVISEWPPKYFVAEYTTRSAPNSSGRLFTGEAKVLSITTSAPYLCARLLIALMSKISRAGFVGVSKNTNFAPF